MKEDVIVKQTYEPVELIGRGGHGETWRARDAGGAAVALKRLRVDRLDDWKVVELFEREAAVLARLDHPRIPTFVDAYREDEAGTRLCLVQRYGEGESLAARLEAGALMDADALVDVARQTLEILAYLHALDPPVVHRDIKPENLIRSPDGALHLVDFGAVQDALMRDGGGSTVVGTSGYMAPEQLMGQACPASDLYGLGATLVRLAAGCEPLELPLERNRVVWRDRASVPEGLGDFVDRLLHPDPRGRFSDARAALEAMARLEEAGFEREHGALTPIGVAGGASTALTRTATGFEIACAPTPWLRIALFQIPVVVAAWWLLTPFVYWLLGPWEAFVGFAEFVTHMFIVISMILFIFLIIMDLFWLKAQRQRPTLWLEPEGMKLEQRRLFGLQRTRRGLGSIRVERAGGDDAARNDVRVVTQHDRQLPILRKLPVAEARAVEETLNGFIVAHTGRGGGRDDD